MHSFFHSFVDLLMVLVKCVVLFLMFKLLSELFNSTVKPVLHLVTVQVSGSSRHLLVG